MQNSFGRSFKRYVQKKNEEKEEIDLYDENRNYIRTIYRGDEIKQNEWKKCILCFVIDKDGYVLIEHKKNDEKDGCSGHIKHNEVAMQAMFREVYEEFKIDIEESLNAIHLGNIAIPFEKTEQKLQCFLDIYCLFRTKDTAIEPNEQEIKGIQRIPFKEFIQEFLNSEIFPCVEEYRPIIQKIVELWEERFERDTVVTAWER